MQIIFLMVQKNKKKAVEDLKHTMNQLTQELNNSVNVTSNVTIATEKTSDEILQTQTRMGLLKDSMQKLVICLRRLKPLLVRLIPLHNRLICFL